MIRYAEMSSAGGRSPSVAKVGQLDGQARAAELRQQPVERREGPRWASFPRGRSPSLSDRSRPSSRRISTSPSRAVTSMLPSASRATSGRSSMTWCATPAWTAMTLIEWATTSCRSRAIRSRSALTARRASSACCSAWRRAPFELFAAPGAAGPQILPGEPGDGHGQQGADPRRCRRHDRRLDQERDDSAESCRRGTPRVLGDDPRAAPPRRPAQRSCTRGMRCSGQSEYADQGQVRDQHREDGNGDAQRPGRRSGRPSVGGRRGGRLTRDERPGRQVDAMPTQSRAARAVSSTGSRTAAQRPGAGGSPRGQLRTAHRAQPSHSDACRRRPQGVLLAVDVRSRGFGWRADDSDRASPRMVMS